MTGQTAAVAETPAPTEADAMGAVWDKLTADGIEEDTQDGLQEEGQGREEVTAAPEQEETAQEAEPKEEAKPAPEAPTDLPANIRAKWGEMPDEARDAVLSSHRDLTRKMADLGRVAQVARPVYDVIVQAAQEIPTMQGMTPQQIAGDVFKMAKIQGAMAANPVETLLGIAKQYGAVDGIRQALSGEPQGQSQDSSALMQEIRTLRAQLQNVSDPSAIERRIEQTLTTRDTERMVAEYAAQKPYWSDVEGIIPQFVAIVQQRGDKTSPQDVLDAAYDMAVHAIPDLRAKLQPAPVVQEAPDPSRVAAQLKAKSVNVVSKPSEPKPLTEKAAMAAIWDKYHN